MSVRALKQLISLTALVMRLIFNCAINLFNCALIMVLTHALFVTFVSLFVLHLQFGLRPEIR